MCSLCLKLNRTYSISFNSSNVGKFFWSWILKDCIKVQKKKKEGPCLVFTSSTKREIRQFNVVVVQRRERNVRAKLVFCQSRPVFLSSLPSPSSLLKLLNCSMFTTVKRVNISKYQPHKPPDVYKWWYLTHLACFQVPKDQKRRKMGHKVNYLHDTLRGYFANLIYANYFITKC